jgi:hypothetical protein
VCKSTPFVSTKKAKPCHASSTPCKKNRCTKNVFRLNYCKYLIYKAFLESAGQFVQVICTSHRQEKSAEVADPFRSPSEDDESSAVFLTWKWLAWLMRYPKQIVNAFLEKYHDRPSQSFSC